MHHGVGHHTIYSEPSLYEPIGSSAAIYQQTRKRFSRSRGPSSANVGFRFKAPPASFFERVVDGTRAIRNDSRDSGSPGHILLGR